MTIFTIGHGNLELREFIKLLERHGIAVLVDIRSQPFSTHSPQFNQGNLASWLEFYNIDYRFLGEELGGRPRDPSLYLANGEPDYDRMEKTAPYQRGIETILTLAEEQRLALMCSEGDYHNCHRHRLVSRTIRMRGVEVKHILPDGSTAVEEGAQLSLGLD